MLRVGRRPSSRFRISVIGAAAAVAIYAAGCRVTDDADLPVVRHAEHPPVHDPRFRQPARRSRRLQSSAASRSPAHGKPVRVSAPWWLWNLFGAQGGVHAGAEERAVAHIRRQRHGRAWPGHPCRPAHRCAFAFVDAQAKPGHDANGSDALILPRRHCDPGLNPGEAIQEQMHDYCRCCHPVDSSRALKRWYEQTAARFPTLINKVSP